MYNTSPYFGCSVYMILVTFFSVLIAALTWVFHNYLSKLISSELVEKISFKFKYILSEVPGNWTSCTVNSVVSALSHCSLTIFTLPCDSTSFWEISVGYREKGFKNQLNYRGRFWYHSTHCSYITEHFIKLISTLK